MIGKTQLRRPSPAAGGGAGPSVADRMVQQECAAAAAFESRWTLRALRRVDAELYEAVCDQRSLFHEALITGEDAAVREHGEAMCRGWAAAVRRLEEAAEPDDAFLLGQDTRTGLKVAISDQRAASARVRELHGERVCFLTPDEVAAMFAGLQGVAAVKALWPNSEVIEVRERAPLGAPPEPVELYPDEPAQEDD